jgi:hypothetical protein
VYFVWFQSASQHGFNMAPAAVAVHYAQYTVHLHHVDYYCMSPSLPLLLLLPGAKEFVPWDQVGTRVPELLEQIQVGLMPSCYNTSKTLISGMRSQKYSCLLVPKRWLCTNPACTL